MSAPAHSDVMSPDDVHRLPALWPPDYEPVPTSLEAPETNVPDSSRQSPWGSVLTSSDPPVTFRHSGWARTRSLVRQALLDNGARPRQIERFDLCGSDPWVYRDADDPTRLVVLANACHNRWCLPCARARGERIAANLRIKLGHDPIRFLTLTLRHSDSPLSEQIDRIYKSFRTLRSRPWWKSAVDGGAAVLEIKHGWHDPRWHVHLHILFTGRFIHQKSIAAEWHRITGDSMIVDIRLLKYAEHAARYVAKYLCKPLPTTAVNRPDQLRELITALNRRRLVLTFGSWRGFRLSEKIDQTDWVALAPLTVLYERKEAGDANAAELLEALERQHPTASILAGRSPPPVVSA